MNRQRRNRLLPLLLAALSLAAAACGDRLPPPTGPGPDEPVLPIPRPGPDQRIMLGRYDGSDVYSVEELSLRDSTFDTVAPYAGALFSYDRKNDLMTLVDVNSLRTTVYSRTIPDSSILTTSGVSVIDPSSVAVAPDGSKMAYMVFDGLSGRIKLRVIRLPLGQGGPPLYETTLLNDAGVNLEHSRLAFSPDSRRLAWFQAFIDGPYRMNGSLRIVDFSKGPSGVKQDSIFGGMSRTWTSVDLADCVWSPTQDNRVAVGVHNEDGTQCIAVFDIDQKRPLDISPGDVTPQMIEFDWKPDGTAIVFTRSANDGSGMPDLWIWSSPGSPGSASYALQLTDSVWEQTPKWSPDGTKILYITGEDHPLNNPGNLYVLDLTSTPPAKRFLANNVVSAFWK